LVPLIFFPTRLEKQKKKKKKNKTKKKKKKIDKILHKKKTNKVKPIQIIKKGK